MFKTAFFVSALSALSFFLSACSAQQVIGTGIAVVKVPINIARGTVGAAGGVVGGTVGGLVAGETGAKYGKLAGQSAAKKAIP